LRLLNSVTTKKGKPATVDSYRGKLLSTPTPGIIEIAPLSAQLESAIVNGSITQIRLIAETKKPLQLCRLLLKMGLEAIAYDSLDDAFAERFDEARRFARAPRSGDSWWFLYSGKHANFDSRSDSESRISLSFHNQFGAEIFVFDLYEFSFLVPMESRVIGDNLHELPEPEFRYFRVVA
jgi:hypothetical protein